MYQCEYKLIQNGHRKVSCVKTKPAWKWPGIKRSEDKTGNLTSKEKIILLTNDRRWSWAATACKSSTWSCHSISLAKSVVVVYIHYFPCCLWYKWVYFSHKQKHSQIQWRKHLFDDNHTYLLMCIIHSRTLWLIDPTKCKSLPQMCTWQSVLESMNNPSSSSLPTCT